MIGVAAAGVMALGAQTTAAVPDDPAFSMRQSCGTVDFGAGLALQGVSGVYTDASVSAKHVNCRSARKIIRKWSNQPQPIWPGTYVANFRCYLSGSEGILKLLCRNVNDSRERVKATLHH